MMLKRVLRLLLVLLLIGGVRGVGMAQAEAVSTNWEVRDSMLTVPAEVTEIPAYAFKDRNDIVGVKFAPGSALRSIGEYAFLGCSNLRHIQLPEGVEECGEGAFRECGLKTVILPGSLRKLPKSMFMWCENLRDITFGTVAGKDTLEDIGSHAFAYCRDLVLGRIPASVSHIGSNAFSRCESLVSVQLPRAMREVESYAFSDCISLQIINLPQTLQAPLGELLCSGCRNLKVIEVGTEPLTIDCNSYIFEPDETELYRQCRLKLYPRERGNLRKYAANQSWHQFTGKISKI